MMKTMKTHSMLILALALGLTACGHKAQTPRETAETIDVAYPRVDSVTLTAEYPGVLSANRKVDVVAKVNGQILSKNFESGTPIHQGQVLFTIDSSTYRARANQAQA